MYPNYINFMGINDLETFKGLINKFDLNDKSQLKVSSMHRFFEEAIGFTSSLLNKKLDFNFEEKLQIDYPDYKHQEYKTIYILTDLIQRKDNVEVIHTLYLNPSNNNSKDLSIS